MFVCIAKRILNYYSEIQPHSNTGNAPQHRTVYVFTTVDYVNWHCLDDISNTFPAPNPYLGKSVLIMPSPSALMHLCYHHHGCSLLNCGAYVKFKLNANFKNYIKMAQFQHLRCCIYRSQIILDNHWILSLNGNLSAAYCLSPSDIRDRLQPTHPPFPRLWIG